MGRWRPLRAFPLGLVAAAALWGGWICLTYTGWDTLFGLMLLLASISPAVGAALAWLVWWLAEWSGKKRSHRI